MITAYEGMLLLSLQDNTNIDDIGGTFIGIYKDVSTDIQWGLIASPSSFQRKFKWQLSKTTLINTTCTDGYINCYNNTKDITNFPAVEYCINLKYYSFNDYYLPSIYELRFLNKKTSLLNTDFYWSSSEVDIQKTFAMTNMMIATIDKYTNLNVLPVRRMIFG